MNTRPELIQLTKWPDHRGVYYPLWKGNPDIVVRQVNVSQSKRGVIRGIHAEPWDKYIHVLNGRAFAAIVDMTSLEIFTFDLDNTVALYVPSGYGNSFQALEDLTYLYLCTGVWDKAMEGKYPSMKYNDPRLAIPWKDIPLIISDKDR